MSKLVCFSKDKFDLRFVNLLKTTLKFRPLVDMCKYLILNTNYT